MEIQDNNKEEEKYIRNQQYVSLAVIAGAFAILTTFLQIDPKYLADFNLKSAVLFLSISIGYLSFDAFFLNNEDPDGNFESKLLAIIRMIFWLLGGIGICFAFNYLPNTTNFSTAYVIALLFVFRFIIMLIAKYLKIKREKKEASR
ncbi:MAG: hypothetical protein GC192_16995 [Bacteroidetes bacterium]|nr:hypothetical protein [Bacteroidota bacterium]